MWPHHHTRHWLARCPPLPMSLLWRSKHKPDPLSFTIRATPIGEKSIIIVLGKGRHNVAANLIWTWSFAPLFVFSAPPRAPSSHARPHHGEQIRKHGML